MTATCARHVTSDPLPQTNRTTSNSATPAVLWIDLVPLTTVEKILEVTLPLPWLFFSLWFYSTNHLLLAALCSFYLFLTGLRLSHGAQHYSLGLPRFAQDLILFTLSILMLASMHSVQASHLHHHRHCLTENDAEGATAKLPFWRALLVGPLFPLRLHLAAWRLGTKRQRRWISLELAAITLTILLGLQFAGILPALALHFSAMLVGECFTGFFAVWTVHHDCETIEDPSHSRTQRGRLINFLSYSMFFHREHHLFPAVPTGHLKILAGRIDALYSQVRPKKVIGC